MNPKTCPDQALGLHRSLEQFKLGHGVAADHDDLAWSNLNRLLDNGAEVILSAVVYLNQEGMGPWGDFDFFQDEGGAIMAHPLGLVNVIEQKLIIYGNDQMEREAAGALDLLELQMLGQFSQFIGRKDLLLDELGAVS